MLNTMMENENKRFTNISIFFSKIMVTEHSVCYHDLRKVIKLLVKPFWFSIIIFHMMMKLLAIFQVKTGKTLIKESYRRIKWSRFSVRHWLSLFILFSSYLTTTFGMSL